jgi:outer membrane protein OmpA-like peptidoglycan-associated protein
VLWAITPEGRAVNLGEVTPGDNGKDKIDVTTDLQAFGMIVTAEPYYSVTHPSNKVVAENIIRQETKGFEEPIDAKFDVLEGKQYVIDVPAEQLPSSQATGNVPLDLLEARNAVVIAKAAGAKQYAPDSLTKAEDMLQRAEDYYQRKQGRTPIGTAARGATQMAEDARVLTLRRKEQERLDAEKRAAQEAQEKAEADAQAAQAQAAQSQAQADEDARRRAQAEQAQAQAELAQAQARLQQQQAEAQAAAAQQAAEDAQHQREEAERQTQEAIQQKEQMRARLLAQLNQVLQTRDTARGLIVSMPDVLFDFNKYTLKPEARERLARISGIVLAYPDLKLQIEGYTDSIGSDEYNQTLSEKRAEAVRDYIVTSGVNMNNVVAEGMGKADPVADNSTAAGRKLNRRVEMVVSGDVIGTQLTPGANGNTNPQ